MIGLNLLAVGVAALAVFVASTVYYMVFARQMADLSPAYATGAGRPPAWKLLIELVRSIVVATVVSVLAVSLDIADPTAAAQLGFGLWIGFPVVLLAGSVIWENVPWKLATIHAGDWLVKLLIIALIVSLWR